ncbi:MAG: hypothetical protein F4152_06005 [Dehalococcoidia bacterium]|nr:hypothetical protein [Dehalococcoidia bacterium]
MAEGEAITREALFRALCEQWQHTEDAIAAVGEHFDKPAHDGWTVGDIFRHLTAISHRESAAVRAMLATGEYEIPGDGENEAEVEKFRSLDYKMLRIELNTAHGVVWMYVQRFSDEDLAQTYKLMGNDWTLGQVLGVVARHEADHVAVALEAAGVPESAVVPVETAHRWT